MGNVLIACEESQRVCTAFRERGHEAYSCDIIECSGGHPEWHIQQDVIPLLNGSCEFTTCDGIRHQINGKWDLIIATRRVHIFPTQDPVGFIHRKVNLTLKGTKKVLKRKRFS